MARYLIIEDRSGLVVNAVEWDGDETRWQPPAGHSALLETQLGNPGDTWDGSTFTSPAPRPKSELQQSQDDLVAELSKQLDDLTVVGNERALVQTLFDFFSKI